MIKIVTLFWITLYIVTNAYAQFILRLDQWWASVLEGYGDSQWNRCGCLAVSPYMRSPISLPIHMVFLFYIAETTHCQFKCSAFNLNCDKCSPMSVTQYSKLGLSHSSIFPRYRKIVLCACAVAVWIWNVQASSRLLTLYTKFVRNWSDYSRDITWDE